MAFWILLSLQHTWRYASSMNENMAERTSSQETQTKKEDKKRCSSVAQRWKAHHDSDASQWCYRVPPLKVQFVEVDFPQQTFEFPLQAVLSVRASTWELSQERLDFTHTRGRGAEGNWGGRINDDGGGVGSSEQSNYNLRFAVQVTVVSPSGCGCARGGEVKCTSPADVEKKQDGKQRQRTRHTGDDFGFHIWEMSEKIINAN